jgi:hypothetical protein
MKKTVFIVLLLCSLSLSSTGQTFRFAAGPVVSVPVGNLGHINGIGIGAELTGILEFSESFEAFGQVGYQRFAGKTFNVLGISVKGDATSHVPVLLGGRYKTNGILVGAGMGYGSYGEGSSGFTFSPQLGYSLEKLDIIGNYTSSSVGGLSLSYFGVKAHYKF